MEMNECIEEFDTRRQTVHHSRPMYSLCALLALQAGRWFIGFRWRTLFFLVLCSRLKS